MRQKPCDLRDYEISLMNSLLFLWAPAARAQCLQSKPSRLKYSFQEEERQKSEAGGRFWISDKLLHLQCRGVFQFLGKVFYSTHHIPLCCPSLTFFFASIVMENNEVSFLFIYMLCKQPGETNSRVILEKSEHSLATFRGCRSYLQKTWAGAGTDYKCEYDFNYFICPLLILVFSLSPPAPIFPHLCFWLYLFPL